MCTARNGLGGTKEHPGGEAFMTKPAFRALLREERVPLLLALLHWLASFYLERLIFTAARSAHLLNYLLCKGLLLLALFGLWRLLWRGLLAPGRRERPESRVLLFALPCLLALLGWMCYHRPLYLAGDEINIFNEAVQFNSFAYWFNYPTGYFWITCLMVVPHPMGPNVVKILLQALLAGYCVARQARLTGGKTAWLLYLLFLLPFVMDQGVTAQRLPTYGVGFLFLTARLCYDRWEGKQPSAAAYVLLCALVGLLAIWRTEGFYLFPLGFVLFCFAWRWRPDRTLLRRAAVYVLLMVLMALPQLMAYQEASAPLSVRSKPLCGYSLCNMFRNGLTEEMLGDDRADIEAYLKVSTIYDYNERLGDRNYEHDYVMDGAEDAPFDVQERFCAAAMRVIRRHPLIYLKMQWQVWRYTSGQYPVTFSGGVLPGLINLSYQQTVPCLLVLFFAVFFLLRRHFLAFFFCLGGLANFVLVFLTKPASLAKYFYVDYLLGVFFLLTAVCFGIHSLGARKRG